MLHRTYVLAICVLMYTVGSILSGTYTHVHSNRHNWRAYLDGLSGTTSLVDAFEASCRGEHREFLPPQPDLGHPFQERDFGHVLDRCWPPSPGKPSNPASAVTSLIFLFVATARPSALSVGLALLAGGSYRHHAQADASGRALDHAAVGLVALLILFAVAQAISARTKYARAVEASAHALMAAGVCAVVAAGNIQDNAYMASAAAVAAGALLSLLHPPIAVNIILPVIAGQFATMQASVHQEHAECTGSLRSARMYDRLHALWHVSVAAAASEALFMRTDRPLPQVISPLSVSILFIVPVAAFTPQSADAAAASVFALSAAGCALQMWLHRPRGDGKVSYNVLENSPL